MNRNFSQTVFTLPLTDGASHGPRRHVGDRRRAQRSGSGLLNVEGDEMGDWEEIQVLDSLTFCTCIGFIGVFHWQVFTPGLKHDEQEFRKSMEGNFKSNDCFCLSRSFLLKGMKS